MPIVKLKMGGEDGTGACPFLAEEGCTVYADRPAACRYYPLGLISVKLKDSEAKEDFHFLVREDHCRRSRQRRKARQLRSCARTRAWSLTTRSTGAGSTF